MTRLLAKLHVCQKHFGGLKKIIDFYQVIIAERLVALIKDSVPCKRISIGEDHAFVLMSRVPKNFKGTDISPSTVPHLTGINVDGVDIRFEPDSIYDIYICIT